MGLAHWRADLARGMRRIRGATVVASHADKGETMSENKGIAGQFVIGDGMAQGGMIERSTPITWELDQPEFVTLPKGAQVYPRPRDEVGEPINVVLMPFRSMDELRAFIDERVRAVLEEDAREVATNPAFQPTTPRKQAGICCACLQAGDDMEWVGYRLAHKTEECRRKAAEMEPVREHRG